MFCQLFLSLSGGPTWRPPTVCRCRCSPPAGSSAGHRLHGGPGLPHGGSTGSGAATAGSDAGGAVRLRSQRGFFFCVSFFPSQVWVKLKKVNLATAGSPHITSEMNYLVLAKVKDYFVEQITKILWKLCKNLLYFYIWK